MQSCVLKPFDFNGHFSLWWIVVITYKLILSTGIFKYCGLEWMQGFIQVNEILMKMPANVQKARKKKTVTRVFKQAFITPVWGRIFQNIQETLKSKHFI